MSNNFEILLLGGDKRQNIIYHEIKQSGVNLSVCGLEKINMDSKPYFDFDKFSIIILPMPVSKDGVNIYSPFSDNIFKLEEIEKLKNKTIIGGIFPKTLNSDFYKNNKIIDFSKSEELLMYNAILTAESAVLVAIQNSQKSLSFSNILIVGNGRIGKSLSNILKGFYSNITVSARKNTDFSSITANGLNSINTSDISKYIENYDYIFNTVPSLVIDENCIKKCKKNCLIIDLASLPGGTDFEACKKHNIAYIHALSLPGKYSPMSAAAAIKKEINQHILEL